MAAAPCTERKKEKEKEKEKEGRPYNILEPVLE
jgi:hypothetical protein